MKVHRRVSGSRVRLIRELQVQERILDYLTGRRKATRAVREAISEYMARLKEKAP